MLSDPSREQEDEWEREAVLDPLWEKQQKKVLFHNIFAQNHLNIIIRLGSNEYNFSLTFDHD